MSQSASDYDDLAPILRTIEKVARDQKWWFLDSPLYLHFLTQRLIERGALGIVIYLAQGPGSLREAQNEPIASLQRLAAAYRIHLSGMAEGEGLLGWFDATKRNDRHVVKTEDVAKIMTFAARAVATARSFGSSWGVAVGIGCIVPPHVPGLTGIPQLDGPKLIDSLLADLVNRTAHLAKDAAQSNCPDILVIRDEHHALEPVPAEWPPHEAVDAKGRTWRVPPPIVEASGTECDWVVAGFCIDVAGFTAATAISPMLSQKVIPDLLAAIEACASADPVFSDKFVISPRSGDCLKGLFLIRAPNVHGAYFEGGGVFLEFLASVSKRMLAVHGSLEVYVRMGVAVVEGSTSTESAPPFTGLLSGNKFRNDQVDGWGKKFVAAAVNTQSSLKRLLDKKKGPAAPGTLVVGYRESDRKVWEKTGMTAFDKWIAV